MRDVRSFIAAAAIATLFTTVLPMTELLAKAGAEDVNQAVRIGQVTEISNTTITIREDTGRYTYRLSSTGQQALDAGLIRVGDRVRVNVYNIWEIAYDFRKMRASESRVEQAKRAGAKGRRAAACIQAGGSDALWPRASVTPPVPDAYECWMRGMVGAP